MDLHASHLLTPLLLLVHAAAALFAATHALLHKRDPRAAWGWIITCWLFPLAGPLLYYVFGINRLRRRARRLMGSPAPLGLAADVPMDRLPVDLGVDRVELRELVRIGGAMTGRALEFGNRIELLHNGEEAYPAMLQAISNAKRTIHLCTYIFEAGEVADRFIEALAAARARGVEVRVLIDGMSEVFFDGQARRRLAAADVWTARFLAPRLFPPRLTINLRNHRKLLIVDGEVAYTGGMNIRDNHLTRPPRKDSTIDLHFEVAGPVVGQLEACFAGDWNLAAGEVLPPPRPGSAQGKSACRAITDGPNEEVDKLVMVLVAAIFHAHERVLIMTPYFIPGAVLVAALQAASLRGVQVHIVLPARSNQRYVDFASRKILDELLDRQVHVWLRPGLFAHTKLFIVDGYYAQIGSANMDQRSLSLNFELVLEVYDRALVETLARGFEEVRVLSSALGAADLKARGRAERLRDAACWLFSPYL